MTERNGNYDVLDTLREAITERGFSDAAIEILRAFLDKKDGFYFPDFIRTYFN